MCVSVTVIPAEICLQMFSVQSDWSPIGKQAHVTIVTAFLVRH